jgi:cytochrome c-type biogenesis protein CcmF
MHLGFDVNKPVRLDYMSLPQMQDGNDLNPLLQNYWMVIHPPVLFMGFASTIVPFAFAIAGLWTKKFKEWTKPALPWALFSAAVLGVGIMMGAKWAYESLTFGGYWAWDPVENASLVPWMILIAGIHTMLIFRHSGYSLRSTYLFFILSFVFVLYSTFLTRSGILGDASVHAFTDLGMNVQLYLLMYVFIWLPPILFANTRKQKIIIASVSLLLLLLTGASTFSLKPIAPVLSLLVLLTGIAFTIYHIQKQVPTIAKEESTSSREFWMFIGSLIFFLSAIVIIGQTSLPVINKIFNIKKAPPEDAEYSYNQIQIFVAIFIGVLTAIIQYLKYKSTSSSFFWKNMWIPTVLAAIASTLVLAFGNINYTKQSYGFLVAIWVAIAASIYAIIANAAYIWLGVKGKLKLSGGSISHVGFGLVLLGVLLSSSKKEILSYNTSGIGMEFGSDSKEKPGENLTLIKGIPIRMGKFDVTYIGDSAHPKKEQRYYKIHFKSREDKEEFTLMPDAFVNYKGNQGLMANPDSRHYWDHDVFTYISSLSNPDNTDTSTFREKDMRVGDSIFYSKGYIILQELNGRDSLPIAGYDPSDKGTVAVMKVYSKNNTSYTSQALLIEKHRDGGVQYLFQPDTVISENLVLRVSNARGDTTATIGVKENEAILQFVTLKAYRFPYIIILWIGIIITAIGILISMVRRIRLNRQKDLVQLN